MKQPAHGGDVVDIEMMDGIIPFNLLLNVQSMIAALGSGFTVQGVVDDTSELPDTGELGDIYLVASEGYATYTWSGTEWVLKLYNVATAEDLQAALYS